MIGEWLEMIELTWGEIFLSLSRISTLPILFSISNPPDQIDYKYLGTRMPIPQQIVVTAVKLGGLFRIFMTD